MVSETRCTIQSQLRIRLIQTTITWNTRRPSLNEWCKCRRFAVNARWRRRAGITDCSDSYYHNGRGKRSFYKSTFYVFEFTSCMPLAYWHKERDVDDSKEVYSSLVRYRGPRYAGKFNFYVNVISGRVDATAFHEVEQPSPSDNNHKSRWQTVHL